MTDTLTDLIDAHLAKACDDPDCRPCRIAEAFCAVAEADDPEPTSDDLDIRDDYRMSRLHIAWRKRQELKAALYDALRKEA